MSDTSVLEVGLAIVVGNQASVANQQIGETSPSCDGF